MSDPMAPLRVMLGLFCIFFAWYFGRSLAASIDAQAADSRLLRWGLRVAVTALGTAWGGMDAVTVVMLGLAAASAGAGFYAAQRPRKA